MPWARAGTRAETRVSLVEGRGLLEGEVQAPR